MSVDAAQAAVSLLGDTLFNPTLSVVYAGLFDNNKGYKRGSHFNSPSLGCVPRPRPLEQYSAS
jgi:hypothetical protein